MAIKEALAGVKRFMSRPKTRNTITLEVPKTEESFGGRVLSDKAVAEEEKRLAKIKQREIEKAEKEKNKVLLEQQKLSKKYGISDEEALGMYNYVSENAQGSSKAMQKKLRKQFFKDNLSDKYSGRTLGEQANFVSQARKDAKGLDKQLNERDAIRAKEAKAAAAAKEQEEKAAIAAKEQQEKETAERVEKVMNTAPYKGHGTNPLPDSTENAVKESGGNGYDAAMRKLKAKDGKADQYAYKRITGEHDGFHAALTDAYQKGDKDAMRALAKEHGIDYSDDVAAMRNSANEQFAKNAEAGPGATDYLFGHNVPQIALGVSIAGGTMAAINSNGGRKSNAELYSNPF